MSWFHDLTSHLPSEQKPPVEKPTPFVDPAVNELHRAISVPENPGITSAEGVDQYAQQVTAAVRNQTGRAVVPR